MNPFIIFEPLKNKKSLKAGIIATLIITFLYFLFSVIVGLVSIEIGYDESFLLMLQFALWKSYSLFTFIDWVFLFAFPLAGGLLFANYKHWKCKSNTSAHVGLMAGMLAAICPACILPLIGAASLTTAIFNVSWIIKISAIVLLISSTYYVAYKQQKCELGK